MRSIFFICLLAVSAALSACSGPARVAVPNLPQAMPVDPPCGSRMLAANTYAGDALHAMLLRRMGSGGGILTATFVDINDFERTSSFGRVTSQQVGSRLGQYGFRIIEARLAATLHMVPRSGEFMLTRETARLLADTYDAHSVLVGSYSDQGGAVYVSARVVRLADNVVMGAYEYYLPRDGDVARLLADGSGGGLIGDGIWDMRNRRTPAFGPGSGGMRADSGGPAQGPAKAVPRHVDPHAAPAAPVKKRTPPKKTTPAATAAPPAVAVPAIPPVPAPAPVPPQKDAPAPSSVPGGV